MPRTFLPLALLLFPWLGAGCRSSAHPPPPSGGPAPEAHADYVFCFLVSGEAREGISAERAGNLQRGHMANIQRLARERSLLLAGPFGADRDPRLRGLFLFDTARPADARALVATDPAVEAGTLAAELHPFRSSPSLRAFPDLYEQHERARLAADPDASAFEGRLYVLALCADAPAAERALAPLVESGRVLFRGRFGPEPAGAPPERAEHAMSGLGGAALFCLDETELEAARARLEAAVARAGLEEELDWQLLPWFATTALVQLPALHARHAEPSAPPERRLELGGSIQAGVEHRR